MFRKLSAALLAAVLALPAIAANKTANFNATANVNANCTFSVSGDLAFGTYDPLVANAAAALPGTTTLTLTCTRGTPSTITMSASANFGSGLGGLRAMTTGAGGAGNTLSYAIYQPSAVGASATATATAWGDPAVAGTGTSFAVAAAPTIASRTITVFGSIPPGQDVSNGSYTDAVTATVNY